MRRILLWIGIALLVVVVALIVVVSLIDVNKYRPRIQAELQTKLGRPVTLGELHLRLLPLSVKVDGATIGESPAFASGQPFAKAGEVYVSVALFSLFGDNPQVKAIELTRPQIEVIRNAQGVWNFSTLGGNQQNASGSTSGGALTLDKLTISDGQIAYTDQQHEVARSIYDHIDAELTDFAPAKPFRLKLNVHLPGEGKQTVRLDAEVGPTKGVAPASLPVNGTFHFDEVTLSGLTRFASGAIPPNTDATITGDGDITTAGETASLKGNLTLQKTTVKGVKLDYPIEGKYDLSTNRKTDLLTIRTMDVKLGDTPISLSGTVDNGKKPAVLDIHVKAQNTSVTDLARLAGALGVAMNPQFQIKGTLNADVTAKGPASEPQLSGSIQAKGLEADGGDIKKPVQVSQLDVTLSPATIVSSPFVAQSGSTKLNMSFSLAQYTTASPNLDATIQTNGANVAELLDMAKAYGVDAAQGATASGSLSLNVHLAGPLKHTEQMVYSGSGTLNGVALNTPSLAKTLAISSANLHFAQNGASIDNFAATLGSSNVQGNLSAKNFSAPELQFNLNSSNINLDELQQISVTPAHATPAAGQSHPPSNEPSLLSRTTGGGAISAAKITAQQFVLTNVKATGKLDHGLITLSPLTAGIFGGSENGSITLNTRPQTPTCSINAKFSGVDTNQLLSATSSMKNKLYGSLTANTNMAFSLASGADLARTMNGNLSFNVADGKIQGINLLQQLSSVSKFLGSAPSQGSGNQTAIKKLSGTLNIRNGVANSDNLTAVLNEGSLAAKGVLNLVDEGINMHATAVLSSGTAQAVGGTKVGGYLNTALSNNKGELVIPVIITGSMDHPSFAPDAQAIAEMKLKNLLPTTSGGSVSGMVNGLLGGGSKSTQGNKGQENSTQDLLNGVLGQFGKKKK